MPITPANPPPTPSPASFCPSCAYDRTGLPENAPCPECNAPAPPPVPATEPAWLELLVRTIFRPRVLWDELVPGTRDGALLISNTMCATALFTGAAFVLGGIPIVTAAWRSGGPHDAIPTLFIGVLIAIIATPFASVGLGLLAALAAVILTTILRAITTPLTPVRSPRYIRPVAAHALFAPAAWGLASWALVILTGILAILLLAIDAHRRTEEGLLVLAGFLNLAIAAAAALHTIVLMVAGMRDPPTHRDEHHIDL